MNRKSAEPARRGDGGAARAECPSGRQRHGKASPPTRADQAERAGLWPLATFEIALVTTTDDARGPCPPVDEGLWRVVRHTGDRTLWRRFTLK